MLAISNGEIAAAKARKAQVAILLVHDTRAGIAAARAPVVPGCYARLPARQEALHEFLFNPSAPAWRQQRLLATMT